jgi:FixJ family two-component response regulator
MNAVEVFIVDDDAGVRTSLSFLLGSAHIACQSFTSAEEFLLSCGPQTQGCLILDVSMHGMSGPQLQAELLRRKFDLPIIFLTGYADVELAVGAMRAGAVDFLAKPINGAVLLQRVGGVLAGQATRLRTATQRAAWETRLTKLTQRERQVLALTLEGMSNKNIASTLQISVRTIEGHRARIYLKLGVTSVMELVSVASHSLYSVQELLASLQTPPL